MGPSYRKGRQYGGWTPYLKKLGDDKSCDDKTWTNIIFIEDEKWKPVFEQYQDLLNKQSPHMTFDFDAVFLRYAIVPSVILWHEYDDIFKLSKFPEITLKNI